MIRNKKNFLAQVLFGTNTLMERLLGAQSSDRLLILAYHRIGELPGPGYPFQNELISGTPDEFDRQLAFLKRHFNVVNFHMLAELEARGESFPPNCVVITFDDGYADNYEVALPILQSHGLTASVFLSTGFIDKQEPFWFEMLSYFIMRMEPGVLSLSRAQFRVEVTESNRLEVRGSLGRGMRVVSDATRLLMLDELREQSGVQPTKNEIDLVRPLTWDQVRALDSAGIEIGSHTVSHPFLVQLRDEELAVELADSKKRIEQELGRPVSSLSYPTGGSEYFDSRSVRVADECGYRFAVSYDHATVQTSKMRRFQIPRIHVEPDVGLPLFKANLMLPRVFVR
jgi:peptidoglycan/xylan/chitin deacetylase (PgdA/CDA1 family)